MFWHTVFVENSAAVKKSFCDRQLCAGTVSSEIGTSGSYHFVTDPCPVWQCPTLHATHCYILQYSLVWSDFTSGPADKTCRELCLKQRSIKYAISGIKDKDLNPEYTSN